MITRLVRQGQVFAFFPIFGKPINPYDEAVIDKDKVLADDPNETGFQRLRKLFKPYYDHSVHPELVAVIQTSLSSFLIGGIYGGCIYSRTAFIEFIENNEATQFRNHLDAKRKLSDKMFINFMRGFVTWGSKVSFFCSSFIVAYTVLSVYRNKDSVLYCAGAGAFAGGAYKSPLGLKGTISGAVFGGLFGSVYGGLKLLILKAFHLSEEELKEKKFELKTKREDAIFNSEREYQMGEVTKEVTDIMINVRS